MGLSSVFIYRDCLLRMSTSTHAVKYGICKKKSIEAAVSLVTFHIVNDVLAIEV